MVTQLTTHEAHAIIDVADIAYSEGLGPDTEERVSAWSALITLAESITGRTAIRTTVTLLKRTRKCSVIQQRH